MMVRRGVLLSAGATVQLIILARRMPPKRGLAGCYCPLNFGNIRTLCSTLSERFFRVDDPNATTICDFEKAVAVGVRQAVLSRDGRAHMGPANNGRRPNELTVLKDDEFLCDAPVFVANPSNSHRRRTICFTLRRPPRFVAVRSSCQFQHRLGLFDGRHFAFCVLANKRGKGF